MFWIYCVDMALADFKYDKMGVTTFVQMICMFRMVRIYGMLAVRNTYNIA